ncbi:ufm1-specific protease 2-like [Gigantopelta aegis]|uniref:ufm1-specific protease 2-like n=1 Tax=Gigantopelta aegis TaxID=1735272 RepID=UPI001B8877D5|nr:ufm1-specific protease 2-like [Gigantopelta aegis]
MEVCVSVHSEVLRALQNVTWKKSGLCGFLVGYGDAQDRKVVAFTLRSEIDCKRVVPDAIEVERLLPGGLSVCGIIVHNVHPTDTTEVAIPNELVEHLDLSPLVVCHIKTEGKVTSDNFYLMLFDNTPVKKTVKTTNTNLLAEYQFFQIKANIPITVAVEADCKDWSNSIETEVDQLCKRVSDGCCMYAISDSAVMFGQGQVKGVQDNALCDNLYEYMQAGDGFLTRSKQKDLKKQSCMQVEIFFLASGEAAFINIPTCAPVIQRKMGTYKCVKINLPLNVISLIKSGTKVNNLQKIFDQAVLSQLQAMKQCILKFSQGDRFHTPEVFHIQPEDLPFIVSVIFPKGVSEQDLESSRRHLHDLFGVVADWPVFKRANVFLLPGDRMLNGYLINPHIGLPPSGIKDGKPCIVHGKYTYHHYMQDHFDDNKWGCAYRSLQTLVSWFHLQGYTDRPVPSHKEIQQALVAVGDKDASFVGSKKWIGSLEVSYCLEQLIQVTSKIISVSSGSELSSKGRELCNHFTTQGSPIMIGGGVLAHTILGVDFNEVTGDVKFLILDPHYTGGEDIKVIQDKGWCGWKGPDFWDSNAHYNLCLPQRPTAI